METNEMIKNVLRAFYYQNYSHRACLREVSFMLFLTLLLGYIIGIFNLFLYIAY
jgi:fatty-acid desaturase